MSKVTFIGAGSVAFAKKFLSDLVLSDELDGMTISLLDIDAQGLANAKALAEKLVAQTKRNMRIEATLDRREALTGADYVINVTMIGGHHCRKLDNQIPIKYGLKAATSCTMGPSGVMFGLRSIPFLLDVAGEMQDVCPDALMMNYHNPQSATVQVWTSTSPVKYVGLCHGVPHTCSQLAEYVGCTDINEIVFFVAGINHMAWVLRFEWNGEDAYPLLGRKMQDPDIYWKDSVRFEMLRHFGYFCTESTFHMSDYLPYFRRTAAMIEKNRLPVSSSLHAQQRAAAEYPQMIKQYLDPNSQIEISESGEEAIRIIRAMETNRPYKCNINVVNHGLIENLPYEAGVEVPTLIDGSGIHPCRIGRLPAHLAALNQTNLNVQQMIAHSILERNKELAAQAVMLDPLTASVMELADMRKMMAELFEAESKWLPDWIVS